MVAQCFAYNFKNGNFSPIYSVVNNMRVEKENLAYELIEFLQFGLALVLEFCGFEVDLRKFLDMLLAVYISGHNPRRNFTYLHVVQLGWVPVLE